MTAGPRGAGSYGWRLGTVGGVPVYLGRSWPVIALVVVVTFGPQVPTPTGEVGGVFGFSVAVVYAVLLLLSVLAHESAHAVVARGCGYRVDRVVADLWGGHTVYDSSASRPGASALIAVSGPAANLAVAAAGYAVGHALGQAPGQALSPDGVPGLLLGAVTWTNLFVGLFNLLPGLPLDGGYLVDALVWKLSGDRSRGLVAAGWLGRVVTVVLLLWVVGRPLLLGRPPSLFTIVWSGLIGAFLWAGATNAIRAGRHRRLVESLPLDAVLRPAVVAWPGEPVAVVLARMDTARAGMRGGAGSGPEAASGAGWSPVAWSGVPDEAHAGARSAPAEAATQPHGSAAGPAGVVLDRNGVPVGLVDIAAARGIDPARAQRVPVEAVTALQPDGWLVVVPSGEVDVSGVVGAVAARAETAPAVPPTMVATTAEGEVLGTVSLADLSAAFRT